MGFTNITHRISITFNRFQTILPAAFDRERSLKFNKSNKNSMHNLSKTRVERNFLQYFSYYMVKFT